MRFTSFSRFNLAAMGCAVMLGTLAGTVAADGGCDRSRVRHHSHRHHHTGHHHRSHVTHGHTTRRAYRAWQSYRQPRVHYNYNAAPRLYSNQCYSYQPRFGDRPYYGGYRHTDRYGDLHHYGYTGHRYNQYPQRRWGAHHTYQHRRWLRSGGTYQSNLYRPKYGNWAYRPDWVYEGYPPPADYEHPVPSYYDDAGYSDVVPETYQPQAYDAGAPVVIIDGEVYTPDELGVEPRHWKYFRPRQQDENDPELKDDPEKRWPAPQLAEAWRQLEAGNAGDAMTQFGDIAMASMGNAEAKVGFAIAAGMNDAHDTAGWAMKRAVMTNPRVLSQIHLTDAAAARCDALLTRYERLQRRSWTERDARIMLVSLHTLRRDTDAAGAVLAQMGGEARRYDRGLQALASAIEHRSLDEQPMVARHEAAQDTSAVVEVTSR